MGTEAPGFNQVNLIVRDMDKTLAFYRRLGLTIDAEPGSEHVGVTFPNGMSMDLDSVEFVPMWDSGWKEPPAAAPSWASRWPPGKPSTTSTPR